MEKFKLAPGQGADQGSDGELPILKGVPLNEILDYEPPEGSPLAGIVAMAVRIVQDNNNVATYAAFGNAPSNPPAPDHQAAQ